MLDWLKGVGNSIGASWGRFRNQTFMDAAMAGAALVAAADGTIQDSEKAAVGGVIGGLPELKDFDAVKLFDLFKANCDIISSQPFVAKTQLLRKIAQLNGKKDAATACLQVVIAVADASDGIDDKEATVIRQIASTLGVDAEPFLPKKS